MAAILLEREPVRNVAVRADATPKERQRRGFTLIEVVVVISIILIIAAIAIPTALNAVKKGNETKAYNEITQIGMALDAFKQQYGMYPPSRIRLREGTKYSTADAFDMHSVQMLRTIWPDIGVQTAAANDPVDLTSPARVNDDQLFEWFREPGTNDTVLDYELEGDECLVFFLGGIAERRTAPSGGFYYVLHGFSKRPQNPSGIATSSAATGARTNQFYVFDAGRLVVRTVTAPAVTPATTANVSPDFGVTTDPRPPKLPSYTAINSLNTPYAYFSSYKGRGYRPDDMNFPTATPNGTEPSISFQITWPRISTNPDANHSTSPAPNPYTTTPSAPVTDTEIIKAFKPDSYQLISAGPDGLFGAGGQLPPADASFATDLGAVDNISNVGDGKTIGDFAKSLLNR